MLPKFTLKFEPTISLPEVVVVVVVGDDILTWSTTWDTKPNEHCVRVSHHKILSFYLNSFLEIIAPTKAKFISYKSNA